MLGNMKLYVLGYFKVFPSLSPSNAILLVPKQTELTNERTNDRAKAKRQQQHDGE